MGSNGLNLANFVLGIARELIDFTILPGFEGRRGSMLDSEVSSLSDKGFFRFLMILGNVRPEGDGDFSNPSLSDSESISISQLDPRGMALLGGAGETRSSKPSLSEKSMSASLTRFSFSGASSSLRIPRAVTSSLTRISEVSSSEEDRVRSVAEPMSSRSLSEGSGEEGSGSGESYVVKTKEGKKKKKIYDKKKKKKKKKKSTN